MLQFDPFLPIQAIIALAIAYCLLWVLLYRRLLAIIMRRTLVRADGDQGAGGWSC